ncbi:MAG TPA: PHP domain-containing protein [Ktedonobacterales bacterium]|nr:PHP domain-containing protein [Ktedonobacterales bacterium]
MRIDLHTHSTASDGVLAPDELARQARAAGLDVIALTDHDSTAGVAAAQAAGERIGLRVVAGIEVNTDLPGGEAHVLGYFVDHEQPAFQQTLTVLREARALRGERMVARLRAAGLDISWERVRELAEGAVGRPHVARALIERGSATSVDDAFARWLGRGRPGYVPRMKLAPAEAVRFIRSAWGVPALAHPAGIADLDSIVLPNLVAAGLLGLECHYGQYDAATVRHLLALATARGLLATGGSDYHGPNMHPTPLGGRAVPPEALAALEHAAAELRRAPAVPFALPTSKPEGSR